MRRIALIADSERFSQEQRFSGPVIVGFIFVHAFFGEAAGNVFVGVLVPVQDRFGVVKICFGYLIGTVYDRDLVGMDHGLSGKAA